jgi:serine/threonine protein kinase/pSer/pThr/pTyr-binding forkhead associated (FHA) protein
MAANMIGKTIENYRIEAMLGQGGMAAVYDVTDLKLDRHVAMKIMHQHLASQRSFREMFVREAQNASRLDHPNIIKVYGFNITGEYLYIVMELIKGGNLRRYVKRLAETGQFIDYPEAAEIVRQIAAAMAYAHERGMVHRDLKPDNVMLKPLAGGRSPGLNYRAIVTDFGLARLTTADDEMDTAQQPIGTYPYMSPEQVNADPIDRRTDLYAMGIILYELSVGRLPFNPKSIAEAARMHMREPLPLPSEFVRGFPEPLETIIVKCLEKDPHDRYQSAEEIITDLTAFIKMGKQPQSKLPEIALPTEKLMITPPVPSEPEPKAPPEPAQPKTDQPAATPDEMRFAPKEPTPNSEAKPRPPSSRVRITPDRDRVPTPQEEMPIEELPTDIQGEAEPPASDAPRYDGDTYAEPGRYDDDDGGKGFITEIETEPMKSNIAPEIPLHIPAATRTDTENDFDCLAVYGAEGSFIVTLDPNNAVFNIGREQTDDVYLPSQNVSRDHAVLERKPNGFYYLVDDNSTNGTFVGERRLNANKPVILYEGVTVRIGPYWLKFLPRIIDNRPAPALPYNEEYATDAGYTPQEPDGEPTQLLGIVPSNAMPKVEPPKLTPEQVVHDRLVIYHKNHAPQVVALVEDVYMVGRNDINDIQLDTPGVSRRHAAVTRGGEFYYIRDMGALNGVWFDQERLEADKPYRLNASRVIRIGDFWLTFEAGRTIGSITRSTGGGIISDLAARGLSSAAASRDDERNDTIDTVLMPRPLDEAPPKLSIPPLSDELRASDRLIFLSEEFPIQVEKLNKEVLTIGRASNQDIRLRGRRISREHLVIELRNDGNIYLTDSDSRNGTWVGDTLLVPQTQVLWRKHETIRIANYWVRFERGTGVLNPFAWALQDPRGLVGQTLGTYRIDRYIGVSSLSSVYKATDVRLERDVGLKILLPERAAEPSARQAFLEEARVLSRLEHPNLVSVMSYNTISNEYFMVMELVTGGTLRSVLLRLSDQGKMMELEDAIDMVIQLANGLHYAHQQGLIHRDIKPESVTLKAEGVVGPIQRYTPVLTDFTVARTTLIEDIHEMDGTQNTYPYLSPEACRGDRIDIRADIYELGTTFYEMLTGRPPFQPRSITEAVRMHTREPVIRPSEFRPDIPAEIEAVIMRSLAKQPADRYQTAIDMARALQRATAIASQEGASIGTGEFITGTFMSSVAREEDATVVMEKALPAEMPLLTDPPQPEGEVLYDRLAFYSEEAPTVVIDVTSPVMTVGRGDDQNVVLPGDAVSRRHARIERSNDGTFRIKDIGSANGTYLGNYKLVEDVIEIWEADETVRLGNYWVRIETREQLEADKLAAARRAAALTPATDKDDYQTDIGAPVQRKRPEHDKIGVEVSASVINVVAGSTAAMSIEVANQNDFVETFEVEIFGLPPEWITQSADEIDLMPFNRQTTSVTFHPPLASRSAAGEHAFEIRVRAKAKQINAVFVQCVLVIEPYHSFNTEIYPERVRNRGRVELTIRNTGNTYDTYNIQTRDREGDVNFSIEGGVQYAIPPGRTENITVRVAPRRRPLFGAARSMPFDVVVQPVDDVAGGPQTRSGELAVTSRFAVWMVVLPLVLLLLCGLIFAGVFAFQRRSVFIAAATATPVAATQAVLQVTETTIAILERDDDNDRLTNLQERELGTEADNADTDGDGLTDGEEVLSWSTDPLNRDTDGDNCTDGEEVDNGTSPLQPDTDGDGIGDCEDPFPNMQATPTPTPRPTIDPSNTSAQCPGSPPSRLSAGTRAFITANPDLANRLREEPNTSATILGFIPAGQGIVILDGPVCDDTDFILWWQVDYNGVQGWTAEGEGEDYYIEPADGGTSGTGDGDSASERGSNDGNSSRTVTDRGGESFIDRVTLANELPSVGSVSFTRADMGLQMYTNITADEWDTVMERAAPLGMGWIKMQANWRYLQADSPNQSTQQLEEFYSHIRTADAAGYNVMLSFAKAPDWARSSTSEAGPPDDPEDLARFIEQMLAAAGGSVDAIEVWNEPNLIREWTGEYEMTGGDYMRLFDASYNRIRAYSPDIVVISAGLAPTLDSDGSRDDREFLREMYENGLGGYSNVAVGVHPYGWGNAPDVVCCATDDSRGWDQDPRFFFLDTLVDYRNIMLRYGDSDAELWVTEFGWTTWRDLNGTPPEAWMALITPQEQAQYIARAFEVGQSLDYVGPMMLWNFNFANTSTVTTGNEIAGFSLVVDDGSSLQSRSVFEQLQALLQ